MDSKIINIINFIFYLLIIIILFNYIKNWNKNIKKLTIQSENIKSKNINNLDSVDSFTNIDKINYNKNTYLDLDIKEYEDITNLGFANELETNEYLHLDEDIQKETDGTNYKLNMNQDEKNKYHNFIQNIKKIESKYTGLQLINEKNKLYMDYLTLINKDNNNFLQKIMILENKYTGEELTNEINKARIEYLKNPKNKSNYNYLETPNVNILNNPLNDPIKLTDKFPRRREELQQEQKYRHYHKLNTDYKKLKNDKLFLQKYDWINKMGKPLPLPDNFNLNTSNDDILQYRQLNGNRTVQDILTDYNPMIMGCPRLTSECVSVIRSEEINGIESIFDLTFTSEDYNNYLDEIKKKEFTKNYYKILGIDD